MPEAIMIGTRGWDYDEWTGGFYPEELPSDWRFAYYSNHFRSVLVPQETWDRDGIDAVRDWLEDCDPEFRFVVELPAALARPGADFDNTLQGFFETIDPMHAQVAGLFLRIGAESAPDDAWLDALLRSLTPNYPLCVDLPISWETQVNLEHYGVGRCWYPERGADPHPGGRLMVALSHEGSARAQRRMLEQLTAWQGASGIAGLFFTAQREATKQASQARVIAELLAI